MIRKFQEWQGWWDGLRSKAMKAGAESITTNLGALMGTNAIANMGIDALKDMGMNWKTFLFTMVLQFAIRVLFAGAQYVANKPDPDVITETIETTHVTKNEVTGSTEIGSSKTTTTTPVEPPKQT